MERGGLLAFNGRVFKGEPGSVGEIGCFDPTGGVPRGSGHLARRAAWGGDNPG